MSLCKGNKSKNKQMELHQIKKLFHSKENYKHKKSQPTKSENTLQMTYLISG